MTESKDSSIGDSSGQALLGSGQAFILRLPDELLLKALRQALPPSLPSRYVWTHDALCYGAVALPLVCRRFNRIATPLLYSGIVLDYTTGETKGPQEAMKYLHRSFRRNPSLWPFCQRLCILHCGRPPPSPPPNLYVAVDLVTWLTATTSLVIKDMFRAEDKTGWYIVGLAVQHMTNLSELSVVEEHDNGLSISKLVSTLGDAARRLKTLDVFGVNKLGKYQDWVELQEKAGTASFTELRLGSFLQTPEVLEGLVRWPTRLEKFTLQQTYRYDYGESGLFGDWSLATLGSILACHKATLRSLKIGGLCRRGLAGFDLSDFTSLEELELSDGCTGADKGLVANLVAPRLNVFRWNMRLEDQQCIERLEGFAQDQEDWLRALVDAAVERRSALRQIEIIFTPEKYVSSLIPDLDAFQYPWDRMDAIARDIRPLGVELWYNEPTLTKEEFLEGIVRAKDPRMSSADAEVSSVDTDSIVDD